MNSVQMSSQSTPSSVPVADRPTALHRFGALIARHPRRVLAGFTLLVVLLGGLGVGVFPRMQSAGYADPGR